MISDGRHDVTPDCPVSLYDHQRVELNEPIRVVVADDDRLILEAIADLLKARYNVVACAENGRELVDAVRKLAPAVVVTDVTMPELNGIEAARQITKTNPATKIVMFSAYHDPAFVGAAVEAGACGYVLKSGPPSELIAAIEDALAGRKHLPAPDGA